jgi:acetyltransferase-like isoleucine patch superfamily enzyme
VNISPITVGDNCGFTGTTLVAADRISMGDRVLVGGNASIVDFDVHPLTPEGRATDLNAGTVVTQDVPPRTVVAGNPATVGREV